MCVRDPGRQCSHRLWRISGVASYEFRLCLCICCFRPDRPDMHADDIVFGLRTWMNPCQLQSSMAVFGFEAERDVETEKMEVQQSCNNIRRCHVGQMCRQRCFATSMLSFRVGPPCAQAPCHHVGSIIALSSVSLASSTPSVFVFRLAMVAFETSAWHRSRQLCALVAKVQESKYRCSISLASRILRCPRRFPVFLFQRISQRRCLSAFASEGKPSSQRPEMHHLGRHSSAQISGRALASQALAPWCRSRDGTP